LIDYEEAYSGPELYWGSEPNALARLAVEARGVGPFRAVDLGCGEGRDLVYFAKHGYRAVGVDLSTAGLAKATAWAKEEGLEVELVRADLVTFRVTAPYDLLYSSGSLTYIPPEAREQAFANYREMAAPGAIVAMNAFVHKPFIPVAPDWGDDEHFYHSGELLMHFASWEVLHFEETVFDCCSGGVPHRHAMNTLIARRIV
jgi:tellurite methyltransferase